MLAFPGGASLLIRFLFDEVMKTYVVVMKQKDEGCDYTIGCGTKYEFIEADGIEEAMRKSYEMWAGDECLSYGERPLHVGERELSKMFI